MRNSTNFTPAFSIGQAVWHAQGAYRLKQQVMIYEIRIHPGDDGNITASYLMQKYENSHYNYWFLQNVLFASIGELDEFLKSNDDNSGTIPK